MDKPKPSFKNFFWYPIETVEAAKLSRMPALIFSVFGAAIWSIIEIFGFFSPSKFGHWAILWAVLLIVISWGLLRMRREAAIAGIVFTFVGLVFNWGIRQAIQGVLMLLIYGLAIRGTFAYMRLSKDLKGINSV